MKFASWVLASTVLLGAIAPSASAQTANQYQHQLNRAVCLNNWTEALSFVRLLIGSEQTTPQQRQQLVTFRNQLENYRASNAVFDRTGDANCAAAIAAAPREAVALQAPSQPRRPVQPSAVSRPVAIAVVPQPVTSSLNAAVPLTIEQVSAFTAGIYCQARRNGLSREAAFEQTGEVFRQSLVDRYGDVAGQAYIEFLRANVPRLQQEVSDALQLQCPELYQASGWN